MHGGGDGERGGSGGDGERGGSGGDGERRGSESGASETSFGEAQDKIAAARVWLLKERPFFGVLARALRVEPARSRQVFRLFEDDRLAVHAGALLQTPFGRLKATLAHLALHAALGAFVRRAGRDAARWNLAHDLAIDPLVRAAGLDLRPAARVVDVPLGASAEEIFALLPEGARPEADACDLFDVFDDDSAKTASRDVDSGDTGVLAVRSAQEQALAWRLRLVSALEAERISGGKTWGSMPGWLSDMLHATIEPPPDWTVLLQRSIATLTRAGRTWQRPSRRLGALCDESGAWPNEVWLPGRRVVTTGQLVCVVDTSGSVPESMLARFLGAVAAAALAVGVDPIRLLQADSAVTSDETMAPSELLTRPIAVRGRGGTSFIPALERLIAESREQGTRFTVVYLTDLVGMLPPTRDARVLDVLWVVPGKLRKKPPFGEVVEIKP